VTPHRVQRTAVRAALTAAAGPARLDARALEELCKRVETTEKMQGQECDVVVACWGALDDAAVAAEVDFVLSRRRLNVAVTRARRAAVLRVSDAVAAPALACGALLTRGRQEGAEYTAGFLARARRVEWGE
jgi:hypothetical protein